MSIGPVQSLGPTGQEQPATPRVHPAQPVSPSDAAGRHSGESDAGRVSEQESPAVHAPTSSLETPEDVVQVQRDPQLKDRIIIRYLDPRSGEVVLQVPSAEVLAVARQIVEGLEQQAAHAFHARRSGGEGENPHGH